MFSRAFLSLMFLLLQDSVDKVVKDLEEIGKESVIVKKIDNEMVANLTEHQVS